MENRDSPQLLSLSLMGQLPLIIFILLCFLSLFGFFDTIMSRHFNMIKGVPQRIVLSVLHFAINLNGVVTSIPPLSQVRNVVYLTLYVFGVKLFCMERQLQFAVSSLI